MAGNPGRQGAETDQKEVSYIVVWRDGKLHKEVAPPPPVGESNGVAGYSPTPAEIRKWLDESCDDCDYEMFVGNRMRSDQGHMHGHKLFYAGRELF